MCMYVVHNSICASGKEKKKIFSLRQYRSYFFFRRRWMGFYIYHKCFQDRSHFAIRLCSIHFELCDDRINDIENVNRQPNIHKRFNLHFTYDKKDTSKCIEVVEVFQNLLLRRRKSHFASYIYRVKNIYVQTIQRKIA